jgi:4-hydroxy-tetrahydrodipicolinate synthase
MTNKKIKGVFPVLVTPFKEDGSLNCDVYRPYLKMLKEAGVDGVVAAGSTGERFNLSNQDHKLTVEVVRKELDDLKWDVPFVVGTSANSSDEAIKYAKHAEDNGADAVMILPRFYPSGGPKGIVRAFKDDSGFVEHYGRIADQINIPIMIYNNPSAVGTDLQPELLASISERIDGGLVKESSGDMTRVQKIQRLTNYEMSVGCGYDPLALPMFMMDSDFWIAPSANAIPSECVELFHCANESRFEEARILYDDVAPLLEYFEETGEYIALSKSALRLAGIPVGYPRGKGPLDPKMEKGLVSLIEQATFIE